MLLNEIFEDYYQADYSLDHPDKRVRVNMPDKRIPTSSTNNIPYSDEVFESVLIDQ